MTSANQVETNLARQGSPARPQWTRLNPVGLIRRALIMYRSIVPTQLRMLFVVVLLVKIGFLGFPGQSYLEQYFVPFIDKALQLPFENPWRLSPPEYFPYGSLLYLFLLLPKLLGFFLFGDAATGTTYLSLALMRLPLLVCDLLLFFFLARLVPKQRGRLTVFYWANPILFYISSVMGQLDVASMALLLGSLFYLQANQITKSACFFAAASLCKFHVFAVLPFMMIYLWNRHFARAALATIARWSTVFFSLFAAGMLPVIFAGNFGHNTLTSPQAGRLLGWQLQLGGETAVLFGLALLMVILGRLCLSSRISREGLVIGSGIVFGTMLLVTYPVPSWYYWFVPFCALFFARYETSHKSLLVLSHVLFFATYVIGPQFYDQAPYGQVLHNGLFTVTQVSFLAILLEMWFIPGQRLFPIDGRLSPFLIGIGGDSGSGKDTLVAQLSDVLNLQRSTTMEGDNYHKWARGHSSWQTYTHLSPKANYLDTMATHTKNILHGETVFQPRYDHDTGRFSAPLPFVPKRFVIIQGLHTLYLKNLREVMRTKIFLDPDPSLRMAWKLRRDVLQRKHPPEKVLAAMKKRQQDSDQFIRPQRQHADWIISYFPINPINFDNLEELDDIELGVTYFFWNDFPVGRLCESLAKFAPNLQKKVEPEADDLDRVSLQIQGRSSKEQIAQCAQELFPHLRQITKGWREPAWRADLEGLTQLAFIALVDNVLEVRRY